MMKDIFNKANSPFFKFGQLMNLKRIAKEYWIPYIMSNFKKTGKTISESQAECLCERVKYNSWYVQQYCFFLWVTHRQRGDARTPRQPAPTGFGHQRRLVLDRDGRAHSHPNRHVESHRFWRKALQCKDVVETYGLGQPQSITRNKKVLVEKDLVEKHLQDFSFVDPVFELWLKREYNILP